MYTAKNANHMKMNFSFDNKNEKRIIMFMTPKKERKKVIGTRVTIPSLTLTHCLKSKCCQCGAKSWHWLYQLDEATYKTNRPLIIRAFFLLAIPLFGKHFVLYLSNKEMIPFSSWNEKNVEQVEDFESFIYFWSNRDLHIYRWLLLLLWKP